MSINTIINEDNRDIHPAAAESAGDIRSYLAVDRKARLKTVSSPTPPDTISLTPNSALVGVASSVVLASNSGRTGLIITNDSNNPIYLAFGAPAFIGKGIPLYGKGSSFCMDAYSYTQESVYAISNVADSNICIQEFM